MCPRPRTACPPDPIKITGRKRGNKPHEANKARYNNMNALSLTLLTHGLFILFGCDTFVVFNTNSFAFQNIAKIRWRYVLFRLSHDFISHFLSIILPQINFGTGRLENGRPVWQGRFGLVKAHYFNSFTIK